MASITETTTTTTHDVIIEHVVLFNINDNQDPQKVNDMVNALNSLNTLDSVLYLTAGPILRTRVLPSSLKFTHMLHARYPSRDALTSYSFHDRHVSVVNTLVKPTCDDVMAVDWDVTLSGNGPVFPKVGSGMRFTFLRASEDNESVKEKVFEGLKKIKESLGGYVQISYGENFSMNRGKGFNIGIVVVFPDLNELDASEEFEDEMRSLIDKIKVDYDDIIAVDYVVPRFNPDLAPIVD